MTLQCSLSITNVFLNCLFFGSLCNGYALGDVFCTDKSTGGTGKLTNLPEQIQRESLYLPFPNWIDAILFAIHQSLQEMCSCKNQFDAQHSVLLDTK